MPLRRIEQSLAPHCLTLAGGLHSGPADTLQTILLVAPAEPGFWPHLKASPEWRDGGADPVDRWSQRILTGVASDLGAQALFPFGGPPWHPFYQWAVGSGQTYDSPVRLLVGSKAGLFASFRGALGFTSKLPLPWPAQRPCDSCAARPCATACPADALTSAGYDLPLCHAYLDTPQGSDCMNNGCVVRRACPVSQSYARLPEQSAYHMRQFHK